MGGSGQIVALKGPADSLALKMKALIIFCFFTQASVM